jgi:uncharacterized membrane protein YeaQ/YmgE (transglycosylase-associated protein family)
MLMWLLAGAAAGWIARSVLDLSAASAVTVSIVVGCVGLIFGGDALAPMVRPHRGEDALSPFAVLVVSIGAIACVKVVSLIGRHIQQSAAARQTNEHPAVSVKSL